MHLMSLERLWGKAMRLALMQPYFFPYIGYFSIVKQVDRYIVLDTVQYIEHGWMNRNRILKPEGGWQYIRVPIKKHSSTALIPEVLIDNSQKWEQKLCNQLQHYKKAPYYEQTMQVVQNILEKKYDAICDLNVAILKGICRYLQIDTQIDLLSEAGLQYEQPQDSDEWGLNICRAVQGVTEYWNAPGGKDFFDLSKYQRYGISVKFQKMILDEYPQKGNAFEPGLSILDVMMFNSPDQITNMMNRYELV